MAHLDCVLDGTSRLPVGPLPDGTVIEVRPAEWSMLARSCEPPLPIDGPNGREWTRLERQSILAAFNAQH